MIVERSFDAERFNAILNHPDVRRGIGDAKVVRADVSELVANKDNVLLLGKHGGTLVIRLLPGIYEPHIAVLPEGRGTWIPRFLCQCRDWMFVNTDCFEILAFVPQTNDAVVRLAAHAGLMHEFELPEATEYLGEKTDVAIMGMRLQDWLLLAADLVEPGQFFLAERVARPTYRHLAVGAMCEMIRAGQVAKGLTVYNRFALAAREPVATLLKSDPPTIRFAGRPMVFSPDGSVYLEDA